MIFTTLTKKALLLAYEAHKDQLDRTGLPYIFHPYRIAEEMIDESSTCVALLHDLIEDTDTTLEDLESEGFPAEVVEGVRLMTHEEDVPYFDYVERLKTNPLARAVKLADLRDNNNVGRLEKVEEEGLKRFEKYREATRILSEVDDQN